MYQCSYRSSLDIVVGILHMYCLLYIPNILWGRLPYINWNSNNIQLLMHSYIVDKQVQYPGITYMNLHKEHMIDWVVSQNLRQGS